MKKGLAFSPLLRLFGAILLTGCASYTDLPPGTVKELACSPVIEREAVTLPTQEAEESPAADYVVGPGDVLFVNVHGMPQLGSPVGGGEKVRGSRVDGSGNIRLPMVGSLHVAGLTVAQIQARLQEAFTRYLKDPWTVVEIAEYKSQPLYLLGQFNQAGTFYMDRPLTLLEGLALGSGLNDTANLRAARLIREKKTVPIDIYRLLQEGAQEQNVWLEAGDAIFVPDDKNQNVFVFGAVNKPGSIPMPNGRLTLSQALAGAGMDGASNNEEHIRIIRSLSATRGELVVVDLRRIIRGEALPFPLMEGDIVYVPKSGVGNWNEAINEILPTLQAISAVLQPFVQIKFLTD